MDKSAKTLTGLMLASLCLALVWTLQGEDRPKPVIPTKAPEQKPAPVLAPPPVHESSPRLASLSLDYQVFSPELSRVLKAAEKSAQSLRAARL